MDPLSISASICALLQTAGIVTSYLNAMKDAPKERARLTTEVYNLCGLLTILRDRVDGAGSEEPWFNVVRKLGVENGPLNDFEVTLERLRSKLEPVGGLKKVGKTLTWKFDMVEIKDMLARIERLKTLIALALADDLFTLSRAIKDDVMDIKSGVAEITAGVTQLQLGHHEKELRDIADWLSPLNPWLTHSDVLQRRQSGTGRWLLESGEFKHWLYGERETLWCPGIPGGGKTVIASIVVDHLQTLFKDQNVAVACIYFNYKERIEQTACNVVASLPKQLIQIQSEASADVKSLYHKHIRQNTRPELGKLVKALQSEIKGYSKVFIVVDALDECPEDNGVRHHILTALQSLAVTVNLMFTSRYLTTIERELQGAIRLDIQANDEDIREYVKGRISREHRLARHIQADAILRDDIENTIVDKARGMFLLAQLHMDSLVSKTNRRAVRRALAKLPKEVDKTYDDAMQRVEAQIDEDRELAIRVLSWLAYTLRPLSVRELRYALTVRPGMTEMDLDSIEDEDLLTSVCAGLVVIDEHSTIIHLVHYTTQEYFERIRNVRFPHTEASIVATCLTYLSFDAFDKDYCRSDKELEEFLEKSPLYDYAARFWGQHARGETEETSKEMALRLLRSSGKLICATQVLFNPVWPFYGIWEWSPVDFSAVHLSSYLGLPKVLRSLIEEGADAAKADGNGWTPLHYAAQEGHEATVRLLMQQRHVGINSKDLTNQTALSVAAERGHEAVVRLLVSAKGIEVDSEDIYQRTPFFRAAKYGREPVVRLLLERKNVDVNFLSIADVSPLSVAAENGYADVVKLLISDHRVDVNILDGFDQTPLSVAALYGHVSVVRLLIDRQDTDIGLKDRTRHGSLLSLAAGNGHEAVVMLLLCHSRVAVDDRNDKGQTALARAAIGGFESIVKLLIGYGFDVNARDVWGQTPLFLAAQHGQVEVVRVLLSHEFVDVVAEDLIGDTPLSMAAKRGHEAIVDLVQSHSRATENSALSGRRHC